MRVGIIGAGSIGLLFAAYLSREFEVTIYTRTLEQADEINNYGVLLRKGSGQAKSLVKALSMAEWKGSEELTIITVKQYQLPAIIKVINELITCPKNLLFIQNGMGHLKQIEDIQANNIYVGAIEHGALKVDSHTVHHNGDGMTNVAVFKGDSLLLQKFITLAPLEFPVVLKENYYVMLLNKLIVNTVINPLTAILHVKNGELIKNQFYFHVVRNLFTEISTILDLKHPEEHLKQVIDICKKTADNRSSMLKDLEANRMTEVDAILGFILEEANVRNVKAPQVENLYFLIKGKEMGKGGAS